MTPMNERPARVLELLAHGPLEIDAITEGLGCGTTTAREVLKKMVDKGEVLVELGRPRRYKFPLRVGAPLAGPSTGATAAALEAIKETRDSLEAADRTIQPETGVGPWDAAMNLHVKLCEALKLHVSASPGDVLDAVDALKTQREAAVSVAERLAGADEAGTVDQLWQKLQSANRLIADVRNAAHAEGEHLTDHVRHLRELAEVIDAVREAAGAPPGVNIVDAVRGLVQGDGNTLKAIRKTLSCPLDDHTLLHLVANMKALWDTCGGDGERRIKTLMGLLEAETLIDAVAEAFSLRVLVRGLKEQRQTLIDDHAALAKFYARRSAGVPAP